MLRFVTTNEGKLREARRYLDDEVVQFDYDYTEIQHEDLAIIATHGAREAFEATEGSDPVIVEDSGLFIDALDGFPGPYSAYVEYTLGIERVAALAGEETDRSAHFRSVIGYCDEHGTEVFTGTVDGEIVPPRGEGGFGYDPIFAVDGRTMAELSTDEKNAISHRGRALEAFAEWYADHDA
ncbi:MAG: XTP/dITP diphosphatase [Halobacteriales archaeon]|nr:XTP/dITP diphosphatase [Halobacteriales archaeon]